MDPSSFDRLSRVLARATTRRAAIGAVLAGIAGAVGIDETSALPSTCVAGGATCKTSSQCCSGRCRMIGGGGVRRVCDCDAETERCGGVCARVDTVERCGSCDISCTAGEQCCNGKCRAVKTDEANCGACGVTCAAGQTCCKGVCVDLDTSKGNCGACGTACTGSKICCDGACKAGGTDENNCGACGNVCAVGETCCGGACVDLTSDEANCGRCNKKCAADKSCADGVCVCNVGRPCNGVCTDTDTDSQHCGACNAPCGQGLTCSGGECLCNGVECGEGTTCVAGVCSCNGSPCDGACCNNTCVDTMTDENHCNACGAACPTGKPCVQGACLTTVCTQPASYSGDCGYFVDCWVTTDGTTHYGEILGAWSAAATCYGEGAGSCPYASDVCVVHMNWLSFGGKFYPNGRCMNKPTTTCTPA